RIPLIGYGGVGEPRAPNSGDIVPGTPALVLPLVALLVLAVVVTSRRPLDGRAKAVLVAVSAVAAALFAGARVVGERGGPTSSSGATRSSGSPSRSPSWRSPVTSQHGDVRSCAPRCMS